MKKRIICLLLLCVLLFSLAGITACKPQVDNPIDITDSEKISTTMQKPDGKTPTDVSAKESLYIAAGELKRSGGFKGTSKGTSTAVLGIEQEIVSERTVVGENVYKMSASGSSFMKSGIQMYIYGENYLARKADKVNSLDNIEWSKTATKYTKDAWSNMIGYRPNGLTGYILNDHTIIDAKLESEKDGMYTFRYVLDTQKAPYFLLYEMRNNANSKSFSTFTKAEIVVTMNSDFVVQTLTTDSEYKASAMGLSNVPCSESITETFFDIGYSGDLPQKAFFEKFFDANAVDKIEDKETTAADILTGMMEPYLIGGETLNLSANVSANNSKVCQANIALHLANTVEDISLKAKVGKDLYLTYNNGNLLIDYQDFHGSTTIDSVLEFVSAILPNVAISKNDLDGNKLLDNLTFEIKNGIARVNVPIDVANLKITIDFFATVEGDSYKFESAKVNVGTIKAELTPIESWKGVEYDGEYAVVELSDLIDNGTITAKTNINNIDVTAMFEIATGNIFVESNIANVALKNNTVFAKLGNAKVMFDTTTADSLLAIMERLLGVDLTVPQIDVDLDDLLTVLGNITATKQEDKVVFAASAEGLGTLEIQLASANGWQLEVIRLNISGQLLEIVPSQSFEAPEIDVENYVDITQVAETLAPSLISLLNTQNYQGELNLKVVSGNDSYSIDGRVLVETITDVETSNTEIALNIDTAICKNDNLFATVNVVFKDSMLYLTVNDVKYAVAVNADTTETDLNTLLENLPQIDIQNDVICAVIEKAQAMGAEIEQGVDIEKVVSAIESLTFENNSLTIGINQLFGISADIALTAIDGGLSLSVDNFALDAFSAKVTASVYETTDNVVVPELSNYTTDIWQLLASENYNISLQGEVSFGNDVYSLDANVLVEQLSKLYVSVLLNYNGVNAIDADIWFADGIVYAEVNGLRFAFAAGQAQLSTQGQTTVNEVLQPLLGYNEYIDKLLNLVIEISDKAQRGEIATDKLVKKLIIGNDDIKVVFDGSQLGLSDFEISVAMSDGVVLSVDNLIYQDIAAQATLQLDVTEQTVSIPDNDWTTNFAVALDQHNTLFASLDILNGVYNFKLENDTTEQLPDGTVATKEPLFICYEMSTNTLLVKKEDSVKASCNITNFAETVAYIDGLVKEFAGQPDNGGTQTPDLSGIDLSTILKDISLQLAADNQTNTVALNVTYASLTASLNVSNDNETKFDSLEICLANKTFVATLCDKFEYADFSDRENYIALDNVLNDYLATIETLVRTNCWQFNFDEDSQIDIKDQQGVVTSYKIAQSSWLKLYFNNAHSEDLMLRANITLQKLNNDVWEDFVKLDVALIDGRIYLTYNDTLKATISLQAIANCTTLAEELQQVIPQIGDLLEKLANAKNEVQNNVGETDITSIIKSISYSENGVFGIVLNGSALLSKLGDVDISVSHTPDSLTLNSLQLSYDNISIALNGVTVRPSALTTEQANETDVVENETTTTKDYDKYVVAQEILSYTTEQGDVDAHMNFDSIRELLRAVIDTASNNTFAIDGKLVADISGIYSVEIGANVRVDVAEDKTVYLAALLTRDSKAVYDDKGGNSYIFYNSKTGMFDLVRDSYNEYTWCSQTNGYGCSNILHPFKGYHTKKILIDSQHKGAPSYHETVDTATFTANIVDYIFELINFNKTLKDIITKNINKDDSSAAQQFKLENFLKGYSYTQGEDNHFDLKLDWAAINNNLGELNLAVHHNITNVEENGQQKEKFSLTRLNGEMTLVKVVKLGIDFTLDQQPVFGDATYFVENTKLWTNGMHAEA